LDTVGLTVYGQPVEQVDHFKYLGRYISNDGTSHYDLNQRLKSGYKSLYANKSLLSGKILSRDKRTNVMKSLPMAIATYGSETWMPTEKEEARMEELFNRGLRITTGLRSKSYPKADGSFYYAFPSNSEVRRCAHQVGTFGDLLKQQRTDFCRKLVRTSTLLPERAVLSMCLGPASEVDVKKPSWLSWYLGLNLADPVTQWMPTKYKNNKRKKAEKTTMQADDAKASDDAHRTELSRDKYFDENERSVCYTVIRDDGEPEDTIQAAREAKAVLIADADFCLPEHPDGPKAPLTRDFRVRRTATYRHWDDMEIPSITREVLASHADDRVKLFYGASPDLDRKQSELVKALSWLDLVPSEPFLHPGCRHPRIVIQSQAEGKWTRLGTHVKAEEGLTTMEYSGHIVDDGDGRNHIPLVGPCQRFEDKTSLSETQAGLLALSEALGMLLSHAETVTAKLEKRAVLLTSTCLEAVKAFTKGPMMCRDPLEFKCWQAMMALAEYGFHFAVVWVPFYIEEMSRVTAPPPLATNILGMRDGLQRRHGIVTHRPGPEGWWGLSHVIDPLATATGSAYCPVRSCQWARRPLPIGELASHLCGRHSHGSVLWDVVPLGCCPKGHRFVGEHDCARPGVLCATCHRYARQGHLCLPDGVPRTQLSSLAEDTHHMDPLPETDPCPAPCDLVVAVETVICLAHGEASRPQREPVHKKDLPEPERRITAPAPARRRRACTGRRPL
jgi:hypothetical protein